jgi:hypothetical protein
MRTGARKEATGSMSKAVYSLCAYFEAFIFWITKITVTISKTFELKQTQNLLDLLREGKFL